MKNIGEQVPDLLGVDENGNEVRISSFIGKKLVLYFYPKDNTSGCTAEACSLRDHYEQIKEAGYEIIGVSIDGEASHRKFIEKQSLPFSLVADTDKQLVQEMGVWAEKSMYGRKYMGTLRTTFLVGNDGAIEHVFSPKEIKTSTHGAQILAHIKK